MASTSLYFRSSFNYWLCPNNLFSRKKPRSLNSNRSEPSGLTAWLILDRVLRRGNPPNVTNSEGFSKSVDLNRIAYHRLTTVSVTYTLTRSRTRPPT
jgi:hypothetical protein